MNQLNKIINNHNNIVKSKDIEIEKGKNEIIKMKIKK